MDTFLTVSKQSSKRALDMPATYVATLTDGEEIFVESYGRKFVWDTTFPSGSSTVDGESFRPLSWSADGAFVADLRGNEKYWRQSAWFVSTLGDDENDGLTSATPFKTDREIQRRWGVGRRARISSAVTITYAQSPANQTNYLFEVVAGGSLKLLGTPTVTKTGTVLTAVQAQVRTAGSEEAWAITGVGLGAADVDKIVVITASGTGANVGAYAAVLKDETAGKLRVSPFGTFNTTTGVFTAVTPQIGDVVEIRDPVATTITLGRIEGHSLASESGAAPATRLLFDSVLLASTSLSGTVFSGGLSVFYVRSALKSLTLAGDAGTSNTLHIVNGGLVPSGGGVIARTVVSFRQTGVKSSILARYGSFVQLSSDVYIQNASVLVSTGAIVQSSGAAFFDVAASNGAAVVSSGGTWAQVGAVPDWGTGNAGHGVTVFGPGNYFYATKPTINSGLGAGREAQVGGADVEYSAIPAAGYINTDNNASLVLTA